MKFSNERKYADLKDLHIAIEQCRRCLKIHPDIVNIQPPWDDNRGHRQSRKWGMLVGQAPGKEEMKQGLRLKQGLETKKNKTDRPGEYDYGVAFRGPAGKCLRKWLEEEAGFSKEELRSWFHKTAVFKCYPGGKGKGYDRQPTATERKNCKHFLEEEIRLRDPQVIITLGAQALHWFRIGLRLDEIVGSKTIWRGRTLVGLPHSSGTSRWLNKNKPEHKKLLKKALKLIGDLRQEAHVYEG